VAPGLLWAEEVARPREEAAPLLPPAWAQVSAQDRLAAKRAAEVDADRLLVERIYGLRIDAQTWVQDLALESDEIRGAVDAMTRGIRTKDVKYNDDLSVEVVKEVTLREVVETIKRVVTRDESRFRVKVSEVENITRETRDTDLAVMGNGAVPGSEGLAKIQAKRAAEMDCYRRLAERVLGIRLTADTTVSNLVLASDQVLSRVAGCLAGVKFTDIAYQPDGSCRVTGRLILRDVIQTIERTSRQYVKGSVVKQEDWEKVKIETRDTVLTETGEGAPRAAGAEEGIATVGQPYFMQRTVIERVIRREVGPVR
jgi:hypothetical protein